MIPAKRSLVDFRESETSALVWIANVREVIVEVVERSIPPGGLDDWSWVRHGAG
jgi:hypothetical protein